MFEYLEALVADYGYLALFIGTFLEGETILIIAGMLAARDVLNIHGAILSALLGTMLGDQCYFLLGRYKGEWLLRKVPKWRPGIEKVLAIAERNRLWLLLTFRFMYGVRNVTSLAFGLTRVPKRVFLLLNFLGATVWALSFGWAGFFAGEVLIRLVENAKNYQLGAFAILGLVGLLVWRLRRRRSRAAAVAASAAETAIVAAPIPAEPVDSAAGPAGRGEASA